MQHGWIMRAVNSQHNELGLTYYDGQYTSDWVRW